MPLKDPGKPRLVLILLFGLQCKARLAARGWRGWVRVELAEVLALDHALVNMASLAVTLCMKQTLSISPQRYDFLRGQGTSFKTALPP